jgi:hypothetical protein
MVHDRVQPTITKDLLMYFYRTSAQNLNVYTQTNFDPNPNPIPDQIFVATRLTAPATLRVIDGR